MMMELLSPVVGMMNLARMAGLAEGDRAAMQEAQESILGWLMAYQAVEKAARSVASLDANLAMALKELDDLWESRKGVTMQEELQAKWDRPGEVFFQVCDSDPLDQNSWWLGWKIARPVKMWFGREEVHQYGSKVISHDGVDREAIFEALGLIREQFDMTMAILDQPAWKRLWRRFVLRLPIRLRMLPSDLQSRLPLRTQLWLIDREGLGQVSIYSRDSAKASAAEPQSAAT